MYDPTKLSSCQLLVHWGVQSEPTDGFPVENHDPIRTGEDFDDGAVIEQGGNDGNY